MDLGVRQIRTAGKGSGSIELTLPAALRDLVGLPCRITLRDGSRPDIVLQPDLRRAYQVFAAMWQTMATALLPLGADLPALPFNAFSFGLQPRAGSVGPHPLARSDQRAFLCWRDGLMLAGEPPHEASVIARTLGALAEAMAGCLLIEQSLAVRFGAACGALVTGVPAAPEVEKSCDLAAAALPPGQSDPADACAAGIASPAFWQHATPLLAAVTDLFTQWTGDPAAHARLGADWRRGQTTGIDGGITP